MNFFRDVVSHLLKNAFEGHTQFSVADNTAVGDNPIRSISLDAVPVNENVMISLAWEGGSKVFEKTLSEQEAQHQFDLISTDLAEVASLTKQGQYDAAKDLMKKLGQKYAENTGELVQTNLPKLHNTQASLEKKASTDYYFESPISLSKIQKIKGLKVYKNNEGSLVMTEGENYVHLNVNDAGLVEGCTRFGGNDPDQILSGLSGYVGDIKDEHEMQDIWYAEAEAEHVKPGHVCDDNCDLYEYPDEQVSAPAPTPAPAPAAKPVKKPVKKQPKRRSSSDPDAHIWKEAKITMQNLWFSNNDELLDYQQKQKGAAKPGDQDHIPLWDKAKGAKPPTDKLAPASLSYEDLESKKEQEHEDMQNHIDEKIKTELESALQEKAASVFGPDQVELVNVLRKNGRNWDEIKKILVKDFGFDKDSTNIFVDEQRQGTDPTGIEVEPVEEKPEDKPLTPPEELVSPETHDKLLQDHEDKKKDNSPVEEPNFTPKEIMDIPEDEIQDESSLSNEIARADNDEIHKVADWREWTKKSCSKCKKELAQGEGLSNNGKTYCDKHWPKKLASIKTAGPSDLNPLQEPIEQEPTTPTQDVVPMGKKPLDHEAPQKGDRVFVVSDMSDEKAGFEGTFVSTYKSQGRDQYIVETDQGDLLDVDAHRVTKISESDGAQTTEPSMEPQIAGTQPDNDIPVTPKMSDFHTAALTLKADVDALLDEVKSIGKTAFVFMKEGMKKEAAQLDSAFEGNAWVRVWVNQDDVELDKRYAEVLKLPDENARIAALKEIAKDIAYNNLHDGVEGASMYANFNVESLEASQHDRIDWGALANPINEEEEDRKFEEEMGRKYGPDAMLPEYRTKSSLKEATKSTKCVKCDKEGPVDQMVSNEHGAGYLCKSHAADWNKDASLKKEAGTTWHDLRMPEPPPAGWRVQHSSGLTGTIVDGNDKFAEVTLDQPIKEDEQTFRTLDLSWVQFSRGDQPKGVYAIYAGDGFGAWSGAPNWTLVDSGGKPIYPKNYQPPKPMEHDKNPNPEPAIDTESAMVNWTCPKCGNAASASSVYDEKICMKDGCGAKMEKQASDFEKGISQNKTSYDSLEKGISQPKTADNQIMTHCNKCKAKFYGDPAESECPACRGVAKEADPVDPAKTKYKEYKITPKYTPKEEAVPATPELDAVLTKMDALQQNLATLETARQQIQAKMQEEMNKIDQQGERVQMEAALQESIEQTAILISAVESKVVQWKDKLFTLQTDEVQYVPKLTQKEMLAKIYEKFAGAEKYVKDVLNGMLSQAKSVTENTLVRWPNKKSSINKEATILDDMNHYNEELMAALQALSSPI